MILMYMLITALGWCLYCLAKYKEHQEICRKEIREILTGRDLANITWYVLTILLYYFHVITYVIYLGKICPNLITLQCVSRRH